MAWQRLKYIFCMFLLVAAGFGLASCGEEPAASADLSAYPAADISAYTGMADYEGDVRYVEMSVREVAELVRQDKSFVFAATFADCGWCNVMMAPLNDAAADAGVYVGLIDTRKDPSWTNNTEIEDYELFVKLFGDYLDRDDAGKPHLYTPHVFCVRNGEVVWQRQGTLTELGATPPESLTPEQYEALEQIYSEGIGKTL